MKCQKLTSELELNLETVEVDSESRVIKNVLLCGNESKNGYKYPPACFKDQNHVVSLYEGKAVCIDHSDKPLNRKIRDVAGFIQNVRLVEGKPYGDIAIESAIDCGVDLLTLAKNKRKNIGVSHVAMCKMSKDRQTVECIEQVVTVDVVFSPATTKTFFEQDQGMELEQLKAENDVLKGKVAVLESDLTKATATAETLKSENTSLLGEVTNLRTEVAEIKPKLESYVKAEQKLADETSVKKLLEEAGLDISDSVVVSEQFMAMLLNASPDARLPLIEDRKAAVSRGGTVTTGTVRSPERTVKTETKAEAFDPLAYLAKFVG